MEAVALVRLALAVITDRLITIMGLIAASIMCGWTMWNPMWERVTTLAIFVVFCYLIVNVKERTKNEPKTENSRE
jgi:membrane protein implicated in regulation of membrane protease activity